MGKFRNTVVMALVLALVGGFVYFYEIRGAAEREAAEEAASKLVALEETADAVGLRLTTADGTIVLRKADDAWRIVEPHDLPADATTVDTILSRLTSATHDRVVEEDAGDLGRFGLANPEVALTVELEGGEELTLDLGRDTPVGASVYALRGGDVVMTSSGIKTAVDKSLFDLRDKRIMTFEEGDVARVELRAPELDVEVERTPGEEGAWRITRPGEMRADAATVGDVLNRLQTDRAREFVAEEPTPEELATYGLDDPAVTVTLWTGEESSQVLQLGAEAEQPAGFYARRGTGPVFIVPASIREEIPGEVDDLRNRLLVDGVSRERVEAAEFTSADGHVRVEKAGAEWRVTEPRAMAGDAGAMSTFISQLMGARAAGFAPGTVGDGGHGFDDPWATVSLEVAPDEAADAPTSGEPAEPAAAGDAGDAAAGEGAAGEDAAAQAADADVSAAARTVTLTVGDATQIPGEEPAAVTGVTGDEEVAEPEPVAVRHVAVSGDPTVYLVAVDDVEGLVLDLFEVRDKTLVSFTQTDLTRLEVTADGTTYAVEKDGDAWRQVAPVEAPVEGSEVSDLLWDLNYLKTTGIATEWAAGGPRPDLSSWGLESPNLRIVARIGDQVVADLSLGDEASVDGVPQVNALAGDSTAVYRVPTRVADAARTLVEALASGD